MLIRVFKKVWERIYPLSHAAFYFQRLFLLPKARLIIARQFAHFLPRTEGAGEHTSEAIRVEEELQRDGVSFLDGLMSATEISEVMDYIADKYCYDRFRSAQSTFHIAAPPASCHVAPYKDTDVIDAPHLLKVANHPRVLAAMERYLGCKPTLSNLALWWTLPGHDGPEDAEFFHRDVDEWSFIKLFVYLTDVTHDCGPHVFVKGSQRLPKLMRIRRYQDQEVVNAFGLQNILSMTGAAGCAFLENTFGMHKGQHAKSGRRLVFQAQYSLFPIGIYKYSPQARSNSDFKLDPYINRLYVKAPKYVS